MRLWIVLYQIFCFFGGTFPTLFAAIQAAEYGGRKTVMNAIVELADEALVILEEVKKDDDVDADKDGKKDVEQISGSELLKRKTLLVLKKMNPEKIDKAISSIYKVYVGRLDFFVDRFRNPSQNPHLTSFTIPQLDDTLQLALGCRRSRCTIRENHFHGVGHCGIPTETLYVTYRRTGRDGDGKF